MIQLSELTKVFGDRVLLDHVTWQITDRERVGLCGPNGAGKTTLLRMMAGLDEPDGGAILKPASLTVGYLPQDGLSHAGRSLFAEASSAFDDLLAMKHEMHALEDRLGDESIPEAEHEAMLSRYEDRLARGLASIINVLDPHVIVLGGGLSNLARLYANVPARWPQWVFSDRVDTRLVAARHGDSSGVRGAAWLWTAAEAADAAG